MHHIFRDREAASRHAADLLAEHLVEDLRSEDAASLIVSGGSTPKRCLNLLAEHDLAWDQVKICLTDERCVDADDELRNARMIAQNLIRSHAAHGQLLELSDAALESIAKPFSVVLVGMGEDGHFASIFPDLDNLEEACDLHGPGRVLQITTTASPVPRLTMTLAQLVQAKEIVLLAFGEQKRLVLDDPTGYPVAHLLQQRETPVSVLWAP